MNRKEKENKIKFCLQTKKNIQESIVDNTIKQIPTACTTAHWCAKNGLQAWLDSAEQPICNLQLWATC